jgi:hypothetical protein
VHLFHTLPKPDVIIIDPPRAGMHPKVVEHLAGLAVETLVYVSCNPATQARDCALLDHVYAVEKALNNHFGPQLWAAERSFAHPLGFGGRVDLSCRSDAIKAFDGIVVDIKSKEGPLESIVPYHENIMQLAAYREGLRTPAARCANIYVNGTTNEVRIVEHDEQDLRDSFECFQSLLRFYQIKNKLSDGYLKINSLSNQTEYMGFINVRYLKTDNISIQIPINGETYVFQRRWHNE